MASYDIDQLHGRILRILLRRANSVTITLLGDMTDRELFRESLRVREQLVREAADASSPVVDKLPVGTIVAVLGMLEGWGFIQWGEGNLGYMMSHFLVKK